MSGTPSRAVRIARFGEPADVLEVATVPAPEPGPGEVVLRLRARPVNPSDLSVVRGRYGELPELPATPGLEGMGEVEALGPGVGSAAVGDRVVPLGISPGTWAERMAVPAAALVPVPDAVGDEAAAQLVVNPLTAWILVTEELGVEPGEWLLQSAAGSTLGRMVIQLGRARGFRTLNVVRRPEQRDELLALGADEVLVAGDDLPERVREVTGGGAPKAIDAVAGALGAAMAASLAPGGTLVVYGRLSQRPMPLDAGLQVFLGTAVRGFWLARWFRETPRERVAGTIGDVLGLMADGTIDPPVEARYDLADVREAAAHAERPGRSGKVILTG
ncbi:zinc-dependent alcohol dehydrogenase family protein [Miltoncostaea marina]|uniref:zinc-dependent alcohol dehydrogenase family protein n=1 Tax=Miltoncostaea marina TaxID=2843215 RepID=UPI001C3DD715|nr:zinc-dependent alcohol dehydrogenase family protein [Miltoncostaea marina]